MPLAISMLSSVGGVGLNWACGSSGGSGSIEEKERRFSDDHIDSIDDDDAAAWMHFEAAMDCFSTIRTAMIRLEIGAREVRLVRSEHLAEEIIVRRDWWNE